jgi:hypothetical protein
VLVTGAADVDGGVVALSVVDVVGLSVVGGVVLSVVDDVVVLGRVVVDRPVVVVVLLGVVRAACDTFVADFAEEPQAASRTAKGSTTLAATSFAP